MSNIPSFFLFCTCLSILLMHVNICDPISENKSNHRQTIVAIAHFVGNVNFCQLKMTLRLYIDTVIIAAELSKD